MFPGDGEVAPVTLQVNVTDAVTNAPVSGATVELYYTLAGYVSETGAAHTKTTDASGKVVFTREELGDAGSKYLNISSGAKRNWASVSATPVLNMTNGNTTVNTKVADVLPQFIALAGNRFALTGYSYPGFPNYMPEAAECLQDDELVFLKTGRVIGYDSGVACGTSFKGFTVAGFDWSAWTLAEAGAKINIKDLDPEYNTANPVSAILTISGDGNTVTIDFGGGYVATLEKI